MVMHPISHGTHQYYLENAANVPIDFVYVKICKRNGEISS